MAPQKKYETILILDNIRSVYNVGAIFRTAEAVGIGKIYLTGITPAPIDRFGRERKDLAKAALGAEKIIRWESIKSIGPLISKLKKEKFHIAAIEQSDESIDYKKFKIKPKTAFILGTEVSGLEKRTLEKCDSIIEIPMKGKKESLNVSVAMGIVLFRVLDI